MTAPNLVHRKALITITDRFEDCTVLKPENVLIHLTYHDRIFDIGALCYRVVEDGPLYSRTNLGRKVCELSFDVARRGPVNALIDYIKSRGSRSTNYLILSAIKSFQNWIDNSYWSNADFTDHHSIKTVYQAYTSHLINLRNLPKTPKNKGLALRNNTASELQKRARIWCHCITGKPLTEIEFWSPRILWNDRESFIPKTSSASLIDCRKTIGSLASIISDVYRGVIDIENRPFKVGNELVRLDKSGLVPEPFLKKVIGVGVMSFIAETGANLAVATKLLLSDEKLKPGTPGNKFIGTKERAAGKEVLLEFSSKYQKIWRKYLKIRELYLNNDESEYLFPYRNSSGALVAYPAARLRERSDSSGLPSWFIRITGERWITARDFRKHREITINEKNGADIIETAALQGRSVSVTLRNYQNRDLKNAAGEISTALHAIYESAIKRTRSKQSISVKIVEDFNDSHVIPTGQCESGPTLAPKLAPGFTENNPLLPDCRSKETCIFCEHYAVHADDQDIRKLLSLRFLCDELKTCMGHDLFVTQWMPVIYRIDEIINAIVRSNPNLKSDLEQIRRDVQLGYLDDFWSKHLDTLINIGVIA